jgi:hypothetical protein
MLNEITQEFPNVTICRKGDSKLMSIISFFLMIMTFGNHKAFMSSFVTTIWNTIYVPDDWNHWLDAERTRILRHERVHLRQAKTYTKIGFSFLYLFVPLPIVFAYFRMKFEKEAYEETMRDLCDRYGKAYLLQPRVKESMVQNFIGPSYLWMWPFRSSISRWYDETVQRIANI